MTNEVKTNQIDFDTKIALERLNEESMEYLTYLGNDILLEKQEIAAKPSRHDNQFLNEDKNELRGFLLALVYMGVLTHYQKRLLTDYFTHFTEKQETSFI